MADCLTTSEPITPHYALLHVQVDFLRSKNQHSWALEVARSAVNSAPSEFATWAKLTEVHVELGHYEQALLTLNSCPMFTVNERDLHRMPTPWRTHLPMRSWVEESGILEEGQKDEETDVALQRLPAPSLKGTFAHAYSILAKLVSHIGWDELLKARSCVFVMEEEYRMQKAQTDIRSAGLSDGGGELNGNANTEGDVDTIRDSGYESTKGKEKEADDNASTHAIVSSTDGEGEAHPNADEDEDKNPPLSPGIPMIKVSSESDTERELAERKGEGEEKEKETEKEADVKEAPDENGVGDVKTNGVDHPPPLEVTAPLQAAVPDEKDDPKSPIDVLEEATQDSGFSFANKRLCERWLDNLFMCLYEVSAFCILQVSHSVPYRTSGYGLSSAPK